MAGRSLFSRFALLAVAYAASLLPGAASAQLQAFSLASSTTTTFPTTTLGSTSSSQTISLTTNRSVTITSVAIAPSVGSHQEFTVGTLSGCALNSAAASGTTCSIPVTFSPYYAGIRAGRLTVTDSTGAVYTVGLTGYGDGPQTLLTPTDVSTLLGTGGGTAYTGDGGVATSARASYPEGVATDAYGNVYFADYGSYNVRVIYQAGAALACLIQIENPSLFGLTAGSTSCSGATSSPVAGYVYTLAGDNSSGTHAVGRTVNVIAASSGATDLYYPSGISVDKEGNIVVASYSSYDLRVIYAGGDTMGCLIEIENPTTFGLATGATSCTGATSAPIPGYLYRIAGTGTAGASGDGGLATSALMAYSYHVAISADDDIYQIDASTNSARTTRIRVTYNGGAKAAALISATNGGITPVKGYIYKVAGGVFGTSGDGGLATSAGITWSKALTLDSDGDVLFNDYNNSSTVSSLAVIARTRVIYNGGARMASLITLENPSVTSPTVGYIYTLAGATNPGTASGNGAIASAASFVTPYGIAVDPADDVFIMDNGDHTIRRISSADGAIYPYAGQSSTTATFANGNSLTTAAIWTGQPIAIGPAGDIVFGDYNVYRVRSVTSNTSAISFSSAVPVGSTGTPTFVYLQNLGTEPVTIASVVASTNFAAVAGTTGALYSKDCTTLPTLQPGDSCAAGAALSPTQLGTVTGTLTITDNSSGTATQHVVNLTGTSSYQAAVTLTSSANPTFSGDTVTLTATVAAATGQDTTAAPTLVGTVTFLDGTTTLGTVTIDSNGVATMTDGPLTAGTHTIKATFTPDSSISSVWAGASATVSQVANAYTTTTTLTSSNASSNLNSSITFTAVSSLASGQTVSSTIPALAGSVSFTSDGTAISGSPVTVDSTGTATLSVSTLTAGTHTIVATFTPSTIYYGSSTATISQVVSSPSYTAVTTNAGVAVATGSSTVVPFTLTSLGGYSGTITAGCSSLPAYMTCSFSPTSTVFSGTNTSKTVNVTIGTSGQSALVAGQKNGVTYAALFGAGILALLAASKRRKLPTLLMAVAGLLAAVTISGCGKSTTSSARGPVSINVTFTDGTTSITVPETVSVLGNP